MSIPHINAIVRTMTFIFSLSIIKESRLIMTNLTKAILTGETFGFPSYLSSFFVTFLCLNSMIIQPKYNSPSREVSSSNASPFHRDGSLPIGGFLLGDVIWHQ